MRPVDEHDRRGGELRADLDGRAERAQVVDQSGGEEDQAAREDPEELPARVERADGEARPTPARKPATMPTPPSEGVVWFDQRSPVGAATTRRAKLDLSVAQRRRRPPEGGYGRERATPNGTEPLFM